MDERLAGTYEKIPHFDEVGDKVVAKAIRRLESAREGWHLV